MLIAFFFNRVDRLESWFLYALAFLLFCYLTMLNCMKKLWSYIFYLFTYNHLACLNQILFGKEYYKLGTFCLFWMETKSTTDSENPCWGEWESQRDNFWLIKTTSKKTSFQFWLFSKDNYIQILKYNTGTNVEQKMYCKNIKKKKVQERRNGLKMSN